MNTKKTLHDKILIASKEIAADKGFQATITDIWYDVFHRTGQYSGSLYPLINAAVSTLTSLLLMPSASKNR